MAAYKFNYAVACPNCKNKLTLGTDKEIIQKRMITVPSCPFCKKEIKVEIGADIGGIYKQLGGAANPELVENQDQNRVKDEEATFIGCGYLVVHDENSKTQTYVLNPGKNVIGRISKVKKNDIAIDVKDNQMHRLHCIITVNQTPQEVDYLLTPHRESVNGVFVNGKEEALHHTEELFLKDGDTIQIGRTKVVLKTTLKAKNSQEAMKQVVDLPYEKTIIM